MARRSKNNIVWDLELHKIEFEKNDPHKIKFIGVGTFEHYNKEMIYSISTPHIPDGEISIAGMGKLKGDRFTEVHIDEASGFFPEFRRLLHPVNCPERYQYYCIYCNKKVETFQEIICDICLKKEKEESLLLENEDPRYNQLILEEE